MNRLQRAIKLLKIRGIRYLGYILVSYLVPRWLYHLFLGWPPPRKVRELFHLQINDPSSVRKGLGEDANFISWANWPVNPFVRKKVDASLCDNPAQEIILGQIDNDGRLLDVFGSLPGWVSVSQSDFVPRYRFPLDIVLKDGIILIRKNFRGNRKLFLQEWHHLAFLTGKANVPALYHVDEVHTILYKSLISGRTIRDVLVDVGANILTAQTEHDPALSNLPVTERLSAILARGTALLKDCFPESFFCELEHQIDRIHREGIAGLSLTFGNIMVDDAGHPWLIDMEGVEIYPSTNHPIFLWHRDQDRQKYNRIYGRNILTEASAREALKRQKEKQGGWYAPIDFGHGLTVGGFWSVDNGTGRWEFLNEKVMAPLLQCKRVLDLGSNNGLMPLLMLRSGASEVIGLELSPEFVESAHQVHRIFEWRAMRPYTFTIHQANMLEILTQDWGQFDVVTALCTLYYLTPDEMAAVVCRAAELAPVMIVQANDHTRSEAGDRKAEKSALPYLQKLMEQNGFPHLDVYAPEGFSRPLLVGRR